MNEQVLQAIKILQQGGIVIFPTDTAFGIGCRIDDEKAVERLFALRKRDKTKAVPVLVANLKMAKNYLQSIPTEVETKLINPYWPGALTIVLPCQTQKISKSVRGGGETLGVRMPDHEILLNIIEQVGVPILGPSANFSGEETPFAFDELNPQLSKLVDYVLPGECKRREASTVIDCSVTPWNILRQGAIKINL